MKLSKDFKLTKEFFRMNEFLANEDPNQISVENSINIKTLADKLEELRKIVGRIDINSGYRSVTFNAKIGGSDGSYHTDGLAADIKFNWGDWKLSTILQIVNYLGFSNIGIYQRSNKFIWLHLDIARPWKHGEYNWIKYSDTLSYKIYQV